MYHREMDEPSFSYWILTQLRCQAMEIRKLHVRAKSILTQLRRQAVEIRKLHAKAKSIYGRLDIFSIRLLHLSSFDYQQDAAQTTSKGDKSLA